MGTHPGREGGGQFEYEKKESVDFLLLVTSLSVRCPAWMLSCSVFKNSQAANLQTKWGGRRGEGAPQVS